MPRRRALSSRNFFLYTPALCLVGVLVLAGDGNFCAKLLGQTSGFGFLGVALAGEDDERHHSKNHPASEDHNSNGTGSHRNSGPHSHDGPHNGGTGSGHSGGGRQAPSQGVGVQLGSHQASVSYDASRNMMKLHVPIGGHLPLGGRRDSHSMLHAGNPESMAVSVGGHLADPQGKAATDTYIRNIVGNKEKEGQTVLALDKSVTPVATRYHSSMFERSEATTIMAKTRVPIGGLSFLQNEVLAVGADQASIDRAQALGFKADPLINSEASDHTIVRFTVPPGLDAIRGQDLLSKELPGQRFELNRVYRLYRASAREEPVTLDKSLPPTVPGNAPTCAATRCFAREVIGWKDTLSQCARGLKVGVIDTDIDEAHPTFDGRHIHRFDFAPDGRLPAPNWHGTAVLSLLAGGSVTSTPGLIPDADFYAANVFYSDERGDMAADTISLLKALDWMKKFDVKLINMSFSGPQDALIGDAIARMSESGVIFVAAAGNEGPTAEPSYPAAYPQVIAVTAVTKDLRNYRYANRGPHIEFSAPGVDIWTAAPGGGAGFHSGTSFAAPHVTAVLAVEPPEALKEGKADLLDNLAVMDLGKEGRDPIYGRGLLLAPSECTPPEEVPETAVASAAE
jgi:subtilisin family serine protease